MKRKKNDPQNFDNIPSTRFENQLKRRREKLEKEEKKRENSRNALFRQRVRDASERKAPKTLRTKAYYRFSSEYPSVVNPDGFRENSKRVSRMSAKKYIITAICCILTFIISFTVVKACILISEKAPPEAENIPADTENVAVSALHFSPEEFSAQTADELIINLKSNGCNTAITEFKDEYGYVYFDIKSAVGASADKKIAGAREKLDELKSKGITCAAYISCFKDTAAAESLSGMELLTSSGSLFRDNSSSCWLDPFSNAAEEYILDIIKKAVDSGFNYILLDNTSFPYEFSVSAPVYKTDSPSAKAKNDRLISFINKATSVAGSDRLIVISDISGFTTLSELPNEKYGGMILNSSCIAYALDLREDKQYKEQLTNTKEFNFIEEMPLAFILDAGAIAAKQLKNEKEASVSVAVIDRDLEDAKEFTVHSGIENIIIW